MITITSLITIGVCTYMMIYSSKIYPKISEYLSVFERKDLKKEISKIRTDYKAILFGYNRVGFGILMALKKLKMSYLVVDFNPETTKNLKKLGIPSLYGDAYDKEMLDDLNLQDARLVISTIPDYETNVVLIRSVRSVNPDAVIIVRAQEIREAFGLYNRGANYVLTPYFLGGEHIANMIDKFKANPDMYRKEKQKHMDLLEGVFEKEKGEKMEEG